REPVLAVAAVKIAPQHAEGERVGAREGVEERLLLGRVALQRRDVSDRDVQRAVLVEADLTDAAPPRPHQAAVAAGEAAHGAALDLLDQISCPHTRVQGLGERGGAAVGSVVGQKVDDAAVRHGWALPGIYAGPELAEGPRRELIEQQ